MATTSYCTSTLSLRPGSFKPVLTSSAFDSAHRQVVGRVFQLRGGNGYDAPDRLAQRVERVVRTAVPRKHGAGCHNPQQPEGKLDVSDGLTTFFSRSYETIMTKKLVTCIQEFKGPQPPAQEINVVTLPLYALGSQASRPIAAIREGHDECRLSPQEQIRLTTWVDADAPYYGSYFGWRNLKCQNLADFCPRPTLESASGILP